ncbi:MAG: hypothetical protein Q9227_003119 [Pyrenula ochraceoflavens]
METRDGIDAEAPVRQTVEKTDGDKPEPSDRKISEDGDTCRICRGEASEDEPLFYPCKCSGSIKFVHQTCLMEWLSHSQKKYCELCKTHFRFTKLYSSRMPQTLPIPIFIRQLIVHVLTNLVTWSRILLVAIVWLGWLPWSIRHVWRAMFFLVDGRWVANRSKEQSNFSPILGFPLGAPLSNSSSLGDRSLLFNISAHSNETESYLGNMSQAFPEFLLIKIVKLLFPMMYRWTLAQSIHGNGLDVLGNNSSIPSPYLHDSLLSDIKYLQNFTTSPRANRILIDTLEGQLICLLIVATFILVFLIREWVINQQPGADLPNNDAAADGLRPLAQDPLAHAANDQHQPAAPPAEGRPIAIPRRRRPWPLPQNVGVGLGADHQPLAQNNNQTNSATVQGFVGIGQQEPPQMESDNDASREDNQRAQSMRPSLHASNANRAAAIQREIEEHRSDTAAHEWPGLDTFKDLWERGGKDPAQVLRLIDEEGRRAELGWVVTHMEALEGAPVPERKSTGHLQARKDSKLVFPSEASDTFSHFHSAARNESNQRRDLARVEQEDSPVPGPAPSTNFTSHFETLATHSLPSNPSSLENVNPDEHGVKAGTISDNLQQDRPSRPEDFHQYTQLRGFEDPAERRELESELGNDRITADGSNGGDIDLIRAPPVGETVNPQDHVVAADQKDASSILDFVANYFWGMPNALPTTEGEQDEDDEHIVHDIAEEPPFVPVPVGQHNYPTSDAVENSEDEETEDDDASTAAGDGAAGEGAQQRDPEVVAAAAEAGIDVNDADAIEDAEDMDGIMELIGLRGPITGLIQNVVFSEFLLTLIIAACIWFPYVWGKVTAVILANPVTCFVKAPLQIVSATADTLVDLLLWLVGCLVKTLEALFRVLTALASHAFPKLQGKFSLPLFRGKPLSFALGATSQLRLGRKISNAFLDMTPDLLLFSAGSHASLNLVKARVISVSRFVGQLTSLLLFHLPLQLHNRICGRETTQTIELVSGFDHWFSMFKLQIGAFGPSAKAIINDLLHLRIRLQMPEVKEPYDYSLAHWNTQDRILAIFLGYAFVAVSGYLYLRIGRIFYRLPQDEKLTGAIADLFRQAGGVLKVVLIIGIEMIIFPLYCGLLLDAAMLPAFEGVGLRSRVAFVMRSPLTGLFVHWFVGTCYMFHFALFVSMCRKILRKGCLYFIRDPDDPNFHPVRDVLERPIITQLSKIVQSALVYGGLVIVCLGVVIWTISKMGTVLPFNYSSALPRLEIPMDLLYFNFVLPFLARKVEISGHVTSLYTWWFQKSARALRLTNFLFGQRCEDEEGRNVHAKWWQFLPTRSVSVADSTLIEGDGSTTAENQEKSSTFLRDGRFVRAPASDSVRIPRGQRVFLEVNEDNERIDGRQDTDDGLHGRQNKNFTKVYVPPQFRFRIITFVLCLWVFVATTAGTAILLPLTVGRSVLKVLLASGERVNDLHALSLGINVCAALVGMMRYVPRKVVTAIAKFKSQRTSLGQAVSRSHSLIVYSLGLMYLVAAFVVVLPLVISVTVELYLVLPMQMYLNSNISTWATSSSFTEDPTTSAPVIHLIQTWTLGLLYTRCLYHLATHYPSPTSRVALAVNAITRDGIFEPNVTLATRAFIVPCLFACAFLLVTPWTMANALTRHYPGYFDNGPYNARAKMMCYAYPAVLGLAVAGYCAVLLKRSLGKWRMRIRDEVYLIGERLHNFGEAKTNSKGRPGTTRNNSVLARIDVGRVG